MLPSFIQEAKLPEVRKAYMNRRYPSTPSFHEKPSSRDIVSIPKKPTPNLLGKATATGRVLCIPQNPYMREIE
jgi:hypothetical protein